MSFSSCSSWLVWVVPILASLLVPLFAKIGGKARDSFVILTGFATLVFAVSMGPGVYFGALVSEELAVQWVPVLDLKVGVLVDPLSVLFVNLIAFLGFVVLTYSLSYMAHEDGLTRYYFFMLLFIGSMSGLVMADNFLQMFVFWEMVGLCSYALVSFWYRNPKAVNAGMKVFLMTKVGDVSLLAAILLIYASLGSMSYHYVFENAGRMVFTMLTAASFLTLIGAMAKSAQLPIHTWLYSAMEAPTSVSCLLHGATMVKGGVYLIARTHIMFYAVPGWLASVALIGAVTALIGATLALHTPDIKGVPAYSTISQIGFMFTALGVASVPGSPGWFAGLFHMLSHAFFQGLGFLAIGSIVHQLGTRDMRKMGGLRRDMPITFFLCLIVILARSGIPPLCSFFSKGLIASSVLATENAFLVFFIYASAAITFAYSLRFLMLTFFGEKSDYVRKVKVHEAPPLMSLSSGILAVFCVGLGFFEAPLIRFMRVNLQISIQQFFSLESVAFIVVLIVGGLPTYLYYRAKTANTQSLRRSYLAPFDKLLENGYFFDFFYEKILVKGFNALAGRVYRFIETAGLERLPYVMAGGAVDLARDVHRFVETAGLERLPYLVSDEAIKVARYTLTRFDASLDTLLALVARETVIKAHGIRKRDSRALPHFVLAAVLGFLILSILLLLTVFR